MLITGICYLGNISRTQRIIKKDIISFPLPVLHYFKTSKSQHLPDIKKKFSIINSKQFFKLFFEEGSQCGLRSFCVVREQKETHVYYSQHAMFPCQEFSLFVNAREQLQCRKHVVIQLPLCVPKAQRWNKAAVSLRLIVHQTQSLNTHFFALNT